MAKDSNGFVKKKIFVFLICFGSENFFEVYIKVITEKCPEKPWQFSNQWKKQKMKENKKKKTKRVEKSDMLVKFMKSATILLVLC